MKTVLKIVGIAFGSVVLFGTGMVLGSTETIRSLEDDKLLDEKANNNYFVKTVHKIRGV